MTSEDSVEPPVPVGLSLPSPQEFFLTIPLYQPFPINEGNRDDIQQLAFFDSTLDSFCVGCKQNSVFVKRLLPSSNRLPTPGYRAKTEGDDRLVDQVFGVNLKCTRNE